MIDIPRLPSYSVTEVLLRIAYVTFKILMIVCIFSDRVLKSSYASVYEFYPAKRKPVSLQCISRRRLTSCLISYLNRDLPCYKGQDFPVRRYAAPRSLWKRVLAT